MRKDAGQIDKADSNRRCICDGRSRGESGRPGTEQRLRKGTAGGKTLSTGTLGAKHPSFPPAVPPSGEGSWLEVNCAWGPVSRFYDLRIQPVSGVRIQNVLDSTYSGNLRCMAKRRVRLSLPSHLR